jgi:beta-lactamase regulating signal transducer with metallopeptidase domain
MVSSDGIGAGFWWVLWAVGAVIVMARLGLGMLRLRATVRGTRPIDDPAWTALVREIARRFGVRRPIALYRGSAGVVPVTSGIARPLIIMPADADAWDDERRRLVLTHEIAHVRRFDVLTHIIGQVAVALFWFHPLAWIAAARMRLERERACDDLVLAAGVRPSRYAGDLLELAEALGGGSVPAAAALAMARRTEIEGRLLAILDGAVSRGPLGARRIASALAGAVVVICALAVVQPVTASPAAVRGREARSHERRESNDAIRRALLAAVATARTDADRRKLLFGSLGHGTRDAAMVADVVRATEAMRDDAEKSMVLRTVAGVDHLSEPVVRTAFFEATNTIKSGADRAAVLLAVLGEVRARDERRAAADSEPAVSLTIASVQTMTSKAAKVRVLREIVRAGWLTKEDVLRQFKICVLTGR